MKFKIELILEDYTMIRAEGVREWLDSLDIPGLTAKLEIEEMAKIVESVQFYNVIITFEGNKEKFLTWKDSIEKFDELTLCFIKNFYKNGLKLDIKVSEV